MAIPSAPKRTIKLELVDMGVEAEAKYEVARHSAPNGTCRRTSNKEDGGSSLDDPCGDSKPTSAGYVDVVFSS